MAQKRMFDKRITDSDKFTDLPNSSKALYFMAGMSADDRGFFQPRRLQKMCGFTDDDFKVLLAKRYFMSFESGVMVITDWNKNNYLDKNRITETEYIDELKLLKLINEKYELDNVCLTNVKPMFNQNSIEENSIDKNSIEECSTEETLFDYLQENGFSLTPIETQIVMEWEDNELTRYAIKQAVLNHVFRIKYIEEILKRYKRDNIKTLQEAIERDENFKNKNAKTIKEDIIPDWFDKDLDNPNIKTAKEMEQLIKELQE